MFKYLLKYSLILLFSSTMFSQNKVDGHKYIASTGNACKDSFTTYFYQELDFKKDSVILTDFQIRSNEPEGKKHIAKSVKYKYIYKNKQILISGTDIKKLSDKDSLLTNDSNLIFTKVVLKLNGKKYTGCHGESCNRTIGGGYMTSDCLIFDFSEKTVTVTSYQKRLDTKERLNQHSNIYPYNIKGNTLYIEHFIYGILEIDSSTIVVKKEDSENLFFNEVKL